MGGDGDGGDGGDGGGGGNDYISVAIVLLSKTFFPVFFFRLLVSSFLHPTPTLSSPHPRLSSESALATSFAPSFRRLREHASYLP